MKNLMVGLLLLVQAATQTPVSGVPTLTVRGRMINESAVPRPATGGGATTPPPYGVQLINNGVVIQTASVPNRGGAFQFRDVRPGRYFVSLEPGIVGLSPIEVVLVDKNVEDLQIRIPTAVLHGTFNIEGGGVLPPIRLVLTSTVRWAGPRTYSVNDSTFSLSEIPLGVYGIEVQGLPKGYSVKSIAAGTANLLSEKLELTAGPSPNIAITISAPPLQH